MKDSIEDILDELVDTPEGEGPYFGVPFARKKIQRLIDQAVVEELKEAMHDHAKFHGDNACNDTYSNFTYLYNRIKELEGQSHKGESKNE